MKILLSSSHFHFNPEVDENKYYHSTGLTVKVFYDALKQFGKVDIINDKDTVDGLDYNLLVSWPRNYAYLTQHNSFKKRICFLNCAEPSYLRIAMALESRRLGCKISDSFWFKDYQDAPLYFLLGRDFNRQRYIAAGVPEDRIRDAWYQTNAIPFKERHKNKRPIFLHFATTLGLRKGFWWAVEDFKKANLDAELWCVGQVQKETFWINYAKEAAKDERIKMIGWVDFEGEKMKEILQTADFMVFPTFGEGQAGTVIEAMAAGCIPLTNAESGVPYFPLGEYKRGDSSIYQRAYDMVGSDFKFIQERGLMELRNNYDNQKFVDYAVEEIDKYLKS